METEPVSVVNADMEPGTCVFNPNSQPYRCSQTQRGQALGPTVVLGAGCAGRYKWGVGSTLLLLVKLCTPHLSQGAPRTPRAQGVLGPVSHEPTSNEKESPLPRRGAQDPILTLRKRARTVGWGPRGSAGMNPPRGEGRWR